MFAFFRWSRLRTPSVFRRNVHYLDGKSLARKIRQNLSQEIRDIRGSRFPRFMPMLAILQVGSRKDSTSYVNSKLKACQESEIACEVFRFPENIPQQILAEKVERLNADPTVHGILIQLPLPLHIEEKVITSLVKSEKDVDGFSSWNIGELAKRDGNPLFIPCTPAGVFRLLQETNINLRGKIACVIGRSDIVGNPVAHILRKADATVIHCHRFTENLENMVNKADIIIVAVGLPEFLKPEWVKPGAVIIDVGINHVVDPSRKSGYNLTGDVQKDVAEKCSYITPVPGGVGPMTVAMLMANVKLAAERQSEVASSSAVSLSPLKIEQKTPSDIEISRSAHLKPITRVAEELKLQPTEFEPYGSYKGKIDLSVLDRLKHRRNGKYVLVAGITPTPLGEGKSTTTMGLVQGLGHLRRLSFANLRQPSMGPTFGIKGGAAGGGYAQVVPMEEFNLHLTGDIHAVTAANNLLAAAIDTRIFHEKTQSDSALFKRLAPNGRLNPVMKRRFEKLGFSGAPSDLTVEQIRKLVRLDFDESTITWKRTVDCNDRHLRGVIVGCGPQEKALTRQTGFDISVASECMAILALSTSLQDMRTRLGNITVASSKNGEPITAEDLGVAGAMSVLMKDAIKPTLMQSLEGTPVLVHAGPFANISIGASSILADKVALKLAGTDSGNPEPGFVVTEAGFDFTMGGERFFDIKCRESELIPDVVVIVTTVRALKLHGGAPAVKPGVPLPKEYFTENLEFVKKGSANLKKQIENAKMFGRPVIVAVNHFKGDTDSEHAVISQAAKDAGAFDAVVCRHWAEGGKGSLDLARSVIKCVGSDESSKTFSPLYDLDTTLEEKLNTIARKFYGASGVELSPLARSRLDQYEAQGFGKLPVCIAKTQYSLSHDPSLRGVPSGFTVPIKDIKVSTGAGYFYAIAAEIMTVPGLPTLPGYMNVDIDSKGEIQGMF